MLVCPHCQMHNDGPAAICRYCKRPLREGRRSESPRFARVRIAGVVLRIAGVVLRIAGGLALVAGGSLVLYSVIRFGTGESVGELLLSGFSLILSGFVWLVLGDVLQMLLHTHAETMRTRSRVLDLGRPAAAAGRLVDPGADDTTQVLISDDVRPSPEES